MDNGHLHTINKKIKIYKTNLAPLHKLLTMPLHYCPHGIFFFPDTIIISACPIVINLEVECVRISF